MKTIFLYFISFLLSLSSTLPPRVTGVTYYVHDGATGNGTLSTPWNYTQWQAGTGGASGVVGGDIVDFKKGQTFNLGILEIRGGNSSLRVTYKSTWGTGNPFKVDGLTTLSSPTLHSGSIYYYSLDVPILHGVYVDGAMKPMGRFPNDSTYLTYESSTDLTGGTYAGSITDNQYSGPDFDGGELVVRKSPWITDRHQITTHSGTTFNFTSSTNRYGNATANPIPGKEYFVQNHINALDVDGEWCYDETLNRVYVFLAGGTSGRTVRVATLDYLASIDSYTTIEGWDWEGGNIGAMMGGGQTQITFFNNNFRKFAGGQAIYGSNVTHFFMDEGSISDCFNNGVTFNHSGNQENRNACNNISVHDVTFNNIGSHHGMGASGDGNQIGIIIVGNGQQILRNKFYNTGYIGISYIGSDVLVQNNFGFWHGVRKQDGAFIYTVESNETKHLNPTNRVVDGNIIIKGVGETAGIYMDDFSTNDIISNNFIMDNDYCAIFNNGTGPKTIYNNTGYNTLRGLHIRHYAAGRMDSMAVNNNTMIAKTGQYAMWFMDNVHESLSNTGTWANNTYAKPIGGNPIYFEYFNNGGLSLSYTVPGWISAKGIESGSTAGTMTVSNDSEFRVEYNATTTAAAVALGAIYKDVQGNSYGPTLTLQPFTGKVLKYHSAATTIQVKRKYNTIQQ